MDQLSNVCDPLTIWHFVHLSIIITMTATRVVLNGVSFPYRKRQLVATCELFDPETGLAEAPSLIRSCVSTSSPEVFLLALDNKPIAISESNYRDLHALCTEFGLKGFSSALRVFEATSRSDRAGRIAELQGRCSSFKRMIAVLQAGASHLKAAQAQGMAFPSVRLVLRLQ
jgi:hypothetical protein